MTSDSIFLFPRRTNFNNIREADHCYRTWKDLKFARKNVIPSNSRPLLNNTITTNCSILKNNILISSNDTNPLSRYINSRQQLSNLNRNISQIDLIYIND